ncbi:hypothetical protein BDW59DRAFT_164598 [Aspergillus cavernicola]|uniref:Uncharacterized protein n=1 Tax=Aspergillus cavernicola TaxID=176166 RepID=A0ABR4I109_9EURO
MSQVDYVLEAEEPSEAKIDVAGQIRDIIEALTEIRAQLADQNNYLDLLAEKYLPAPSTIEIIDVTEDEWTEEIKPSLERWHESRFPDPDRLDRIGENFLDQISYCGPNYDGGSFWTVPESSHGRNCDPVRLKFADVHLSSGPDEGLKASLMSTWPTHLVAQSEYSLQPVDYDHDGPWDDYDLFSPATRYIRVYETGYCDELFPEIGSLSMISDTGAMEKVHANETESFPDPQPWLRKVFGHIIVVSLCDTAVIPMQTIALLLWQLQHYSSYSTPTTLGSSNHDHHNFHNSAFLMEFTSPWKRARWIRVDEVAQNAKVTDTGLHLQRDRGDIPNPGEDNANTSPDLYLSEVRHGFKIATTLDLSLPLYTVVIIGDGDPAQTDDGIPDFLNRNIQNEKAGSYRAGRLTGVGVFLLLISASLESVSNTWISSLDRLSDTLDTSLAQFARVKRQKLMFDHELFSKSDQYFAVLQVLRICTEWIEGTLRDLKELCQEIEAGLLDTELEIPAPDQEGLNAIITAVIADSEMRFRPLLERIERKVADVKGLRDGLFNATSVREASKGTSLARNSGRQNRYHVLVFTVATVFYLPMGFVTSFFGVHLFDSNGDGAASRIPVIITFIILSLATYFTAVSALWFVRDGDWIKDALASWKPERISQGLEPHGSKENQAFQAF